MFDQVGADIVLAGQVEGLGEEKVAQGTDDLFCRIAQFEIITEGVFLAFFEYAFHSLPLIRVLLIRK